MPPPPSLKRGLGCRVGSHLGLACCRRPCCMPNYLAKHINRAHPPPYAGLAWCLRLNLIVGGHNMAQMELRLICDPFRLGANCCHSDCLKAKVKVP